MEELERNIVIMYGSQTGTAQYVAERIAREAKRLHFAGICNFYGNVYNSVSWYKRYIKLVVLIVEIGLIILVPIDTN